MGSIPAPVKFELLKIIVLTLAVTVARPNSLIGRNFPITGCLTVDPPENNRHTICSRVQGQRAIHNLSLIHI